MESLRLIEMEDLKKLCIHLYGGYNLKTLRGYEAVETLIRNNWDNFNHLIADEEIFCNSSTEKVASNEFYEQVTLMVCVEDTGIGILLSA